MDQSEPLSKQLLSSKQMRKRAEEDVALLQNRIKLRQLEESKAKKKIDETVKKTESIQKVQERNIASA